MFSAQRLLQKLLLFPTILIIINCRPPVSTIPDPDYQIPENVIILISFDGFRWDYFDKTDTPNLDKLITGGVKADALISAFPSKTFPNHYSIATGLYPENHGIVFNTMYDPVFDATFSLGNRAAVQDGRWWGGEPIWVTAEKQGLITFCNFWPGSEAEITGISPTHWVKYDGEVPNAERVDNIFEYLDLQKEKTPSFYTLYFSDCDDIGHLVGPDSPLVSSCIEEVDDRVGQLINGLEERKLFDKVNIIITSDHGMAQLSSERIIFLDDYLDPTNLKIPNWSPVMDLWCEESEVDSIFNLINGKHPHLSAYKKQDIPERLHFSNNRRIAPIIGIMDNGWSLTDRDYYTSHPTYFDGGTHGYDPQHSDMHAIFIAHGPAFKSGTTTPAFENIHIYNLMARVLAIVPAENDGDFEVIKDILK